jgi:cytochrome c553
MSAASHTAAYGVVFALVMLLGGCNREQSAPAASGGSQASGAASAGSATSAPASAPAPAAASSPASATPSAAASSAPAAAAAPLVPTQVRTVLVASTQDVSAGRQLATQGASGAAACSGCHGANGEGNPQTGFPRLAGLGQPYIEHQLNSYADGSRVNPMMSPIATALNPAQRSAAAAYYASLGGAPAATRSAPRGAAPVLAVRGDESKGIQSCANCHGPQGIGDAAANPYLAGQNATYLTNALAAWKGGTRHNDPSGQMPAIAKALSDADTKTLVAYFSGLPPPAPGNSQAATVASAGNSARAEVHSGPVAATAPQQGIGTEQGAPLTGGSQGQGSGGAATNPAQSGPSKP